MAASASFAGVVFFNPVLGVFLPALTDEFGWSRADISLAVTIGSAAGALSAPALGWVIDRWGGRWVMGGAALAMGLCLLALGAMTALWQLYIFYSLGRGLSQSAINSAAFVGVSNWFVRRRPLAVALLSVGQRLGMAAVPLLAAVVIAQADWRAGWLALAAISLGIGVVPPLLLMRRRPEDVGLAPDGGPVAGEQDELPAREREYALREALRTRGYWLVGVAIAAIMFSAGSINLHQIPHMVDQGLDPTRAATVVAVFSAAGALGGLAAGAVSTRWGVRATLAAALVGQSGGALLLVAVAGMAGALAFAVWYGLCFGAALTLQQVIYADYFGRSSLGTIRGSALPVQLAFNATGPWLAGLWYDRAGSYDAVFQLFAALFLAAAVLIAIAPRPGRVRRSRSPAG